MKPIATVVCATIIGPAAVLAQQVTLVRDGEPRAAIVIPDEPLASERFAAEELQTYLERMSGARLEIRPESHRSAGAAITVGATSDVPDHLMDELAVEECVIRTVSPRHLMIVGGREPPIVDSKGKSWVRDRGTLYGVYELLHMLGVRWYDPSPVGEVVPRAKTITVGPLDYRHKPAFSIRSGYGGIWAVRNRYSGNVWGPDEWGGIHYEWLAHMYQYVVPPHAYFERKPEWFALIGRERTPKGQLCISNPEVVDRFVEWAVGTYRANPQLEVLGIEANDGHGWCECGDCRAMDDPRLLTPYNQVSMSPRVVKFNMQVARRVAELNPNAILGWYIYSDHTEVPRGLQRLPGNLHGRICTYASSYSDYSEPIETGTSPQNTRLREVFEGYRRLLEHISTYEYWSGYVWFGPIPIRKAIAANIRYYHRLGVEGCYQLGPRHWGSQGVNYWMAGRLLWDVTEDEDELLDDYCRGMYGPAAEHMKRYYLRLEKAVADSGRAVMSGGAYIEPIFTTDVLDEALHHLQQALRVAETPEQRARIERATAGHEFARRAARMDRLEAAGKVEEALAEGRDLIAWMEAINPGKETREAHLRARQDEIARLTREGNLDEASTKARELQEWLDRLNEGQWVFAALDTEPGAHLTGRVAKLAETVKDFARVMAVSDVVCEVPQNWRFRTDPNREGETGRWFATEFDDSEWAAIPIGVWWENAGYVGYDGLAWYRTSLHIPEDFRGRKVEAFFGAVDGDATVYVNGERAGEHVLGDNGEGWDEAFSIDITEHVECGAENQMTVAVLDEAAYGGIWKAVRVLSPRPGTTTQGRIRQPLRKDEHTVLLLDFTQPVEGWMANEKYGEGPFPGQGAQNRAAWFASPDKERTGIRTSVNLPANGTVECWVKPTGIQGGHATLFTVGSVGNTKVNAFVGRDNRVHATIVRETNTEALVSGVVLPDAQWTHVAVTWGEGIKPRLYINGRLEAEGKQTGPPYHTGGDVLWIGCQPWWVKDREDHTAWYLDLNFHGLIDDLRVSAVARDEFEALQE